MGKATKKSTKKFKNSGQLQKTIEHRKKVQKSNKKFQSRRGAKQSGRPAAALHQDEQEEEQVPRTKSKAKGKSVDDFLNADFMDEEEDDNESNEDLDSDISQDDDDDDDFESVDDLEDEGEAHMLELSQLAKKDPEFFKYLQENDKELLDFDPDAASGDDEDEDMAGPSSRRTVLTKALLQEWQKLLIDQQSLKALRKLLLAFRAAVRIHDDDAEDLAFSIDDPDVYQKLVVTALTYTPMIMSHHVPIKILPNGKFKPPTQSNKQRTLQKLIQAFFNNVLLLLDQLTDPETIKVALRESAKLIPYVIGARKVVKTFLKKCLGIWSSAEETLRIAAFVAIRKLMQSSDESIIDLVLKNTYLTFIRSSKQTNPYTLNAINIMKNSASDAFCLDHETSYQHAFGYIRQLAIHLRNSMKVKTKEAYKQVYNWQFAHCVDFWCIVLARACDYSAQVENGGSESAMKPLIYPLVQVSIGAIRLISSPRSFPFHLQIARSLNFLTRHVRVYVPLAPHLFPILTSSMAPSSHPKASTLRPLDLEVYIRTPAQYVKTRQYTEGLVDEVCYVIAEYLGSVPVINSIAFPELVVPLTVQMRRMVKQGRASKHSSSKDIGLLKGLLDRVDENATWIESRRKNVTFSPADLSEVDDWENKVDTETSPLAKYLKLLRKTRDKRRQMLEKAREGQGEIVGQDDGSDEE